jgi:tartrate dehydratase beta subunit/fumarate hydratase class I family protein
MTVSDVVNEANARVPRYFNKGDLLNAGIAQRDGTVKVSPYAPTDSSQMEKGTIIIRPSQPPLFRRGPVIVVPKSMMDRKVSDITGARKA